MQNAAFSPPALVPELYTQRLRLRAFRSDDLPEYTALHQDPDFYRHLSGKPVSEEDTWRRMLGLIGHWALRGYGYWALEERANGRFCGTVGLAEYCRGLTPSIADIPEAGWVLAPRLHGQGYAAEAVTAALAWTDDHLAAPRTVCIINSENAPSLRLAARFGYREIARPTYHNEPIVLLERRVGEVVM